MHNFNIFKERNEPESEFCIVLGKHEQVAATTAGSNRTYNRRNEQTKIENQETLILRRNAAQVKEQSKKTLQ